jgi:hypothetical protein
MSTQVFAAIHESDAGDGAELAKQPKLAGDGIELFDAGRAERAEKMSRGGAESSVCFLGVLCASA